MEVVKEGFYPVYVQDGIVYPVALTKEQYDIFTLMFSTVMGGTKVAVALNHPMGTAVDLKGIKKKGDK